MFNKVIMVGNLTKDIELRYTQSGTAIGSTSIAVNKKFKTASGEMKDDTCFVDLTFWGRTAEVANQYLRKGSKTLIEGELKLERWQDQNGQNRSKHSITVSTMQMLDSKRDDSYQGGGNNQSNQNQGDSYQSTNQSSNQNNQSNQNTATSNYYQDSGSSSRASNSTSSDYGNNNKIPDIDIDEEDIPF